MDTNKQFRSNSLGTFNVESDYVIRKCTEDDLEGVIEVNEAELPEDYPYFFYKSILDNYPKAFMVACPKENPEEIIGYVMWRIEKKPLLGNLKVAQKGHLVSIAVLEGYRRRNIATRLLLKSMPQIKKHGITSYVLEVRVSNFSAINLYKKLGFKIDSIKKHYYRDDENAYYMVRELNKKLDSDIL